MATRYTLVVTFGGDESEAPENWEQDAIAHISTLISRDFTSGETTIWGESNGYRVFWTLDAEDE